MSWSQSVDQTLCFGWIDGIRKSIDKKSYCIRFTPRKPGGTWSAVNIKKVVELTKNGLMHPAGTVLFENRKVSETNSYSFKNENKNLPEQYEIEFKSNKKAWEFFTKQAQSYKRTTTLYIMSANQEETRMWSLRKTISECEKGNKIY